MSSTNNTAQIGYQWKPTTNKVVKQKRQDFSEKNSIDENGISLCLRFVFKNINPDRVFQVMNNPTFILENGKKIKCSFGEIERIDYIFRRDGNKTYFIHFHKKGWNFKNRNAIDALECMKKGKAIEIINDDRGHFWKGTISKAQRPQDANQHKLEPEQKLQDYSDGEEFDVYQEGPFAIDYDEFPDIKNEVAAELKKIKQEGEEKTPDNAINKDE